MAFLPMDLRHSRGKCNIKIKVKFVLTLQHLFIIDSQTSNKLCSNQVKGDTSLPYLCPSDDFSICFILRSMEDLHICYRLHGLPIYWTYDTKAKRNNSKLRIQFAYQVLLLVYKAVLLSVTTQHITARRLQECT